MRTTWFREKSFAYPPQYIKQTIRDLLKGSQARTIDHANPLLESHHPPHILTHCYGNLAVYLMNWHGEPILKHATLLDFQKISMHLYVHQLTAAFLAKMVFDEKLSFEHMRNIAIHHQFPKVVSPELSDIFNRGLVELHQHYNASQLATNIWSSAIEMPSAILNEQRRDDHRTKIPEEWRDKDLYFHLLNAKSIRGFLVYYLYRERQRIALEEDHVRHIQTTIETLLRSIPNHYKDQHHTHASYCQPRWVNDQAYDSECCLLAECFLTCFRAFCGHPRAMNHEQKLFFLSFHYYLAIQNIFLKSFVQQEEHYGFDSFSRYERAPAHLAFRRKDFAGALKEYRQTHHLKAVELRLTPEDDAYSQVLKLQPFMNELDKHQPTKELAERMSRLWAGTLHAHGQRSAEPLEPERVAHSLEKLLCDAEQSREIRVACGFNFHVIKEPDPDLRLEGFLQGMDLESGPFDKNYSRTFHVARHHQLRRKVFLQARAIVKAKSLDRRYPLYVLGIDAANDEYFARPEVFAPAFRYARDAFAQEEGSVLDHEPPLPQAFRPLRITFHAGESFDHLLNGIRYVDEALTFLDMRRGDRIGHGLALGVDPQNWVQHYSGAKLKVGEWFDSLVWMHHILLYNGDESHRQVLPYLATEIDRLKHRIYDRHFRGRTLHLEIGTLYNAWQFRAQEASTWVKDHCDFIEKEYQAAKKQFAKFNGNSDRSDVHTLWLAYHFSTKTRRAYIKADEKPELFVAEKTWAEALRCCQETVMKKMVDREIAIEVNPTSNLRIGPFENLRDHPLFRWFPVRPEERSERSNPICTINGDNYAVFQTTLPLEYAYLAQAARQQESKDYTPSEIATWLNQLRVNGFKYSFMELNANQNVGY